MLSGHPKVEHSVVTAPKCAAMLLDAGPVDVAGLSTVVRIIDDDIEILREGKGDIDLLYQ